ncbi:MAG: L-tyrosine/L-tryptophan isonitrile synthase family protein [Pseudonocardiaceae bacterium]|nr:L-tyrosine/L-tryptophan isonitrile synthase family protein [Pseudonocardiaceae bacterium]
MRSDGGPRVSVDATVVPLPAGAAGYGTETRPTGWPQQLGTGRTLETRPPSDPLSVSNARSLGGLPLTELASAAGVAREQLHLDASEVGTLLRALRRNADAASARLAEATRNHLGRRDTGRSLQRPHDVAAALHRMLTRSRFLKGSRSCFPPATAAEQIVPFVEQHRPVTLMVTGFPFKQHDNGLKAVGPHPDLAEFGALLRLRELHRAFVELYSPGLRIIVLADGGYARPRAWSEVFRYRDRLAHFAQLAGVGGAVEFADQNRYVARLLGEQGWREREGIRRRLRERIGAVAGQPRSLAEAGVAERRIADALSAELLDGLPAFRDIVSSLIYSVPVPTPHDTDPLSWACRLLAYPDPLNDAGVPDELVRARRAVLGSAWRNAVDHLSASAADNAVGVAARYPLHVRLATVASRHGASGFSYLGGSTLLPWHATGCLDGRGRLCADFAVSLLDRGFLAVHAPELSGSDSGSEDDGDQPMLMVPFARTVFSDGCRRVDPELLAAARLRSR